MQVIVNKHSIRLVSPVSVVLTLLAASVAQADQPALVHPYLIEVFAIADLPVTGKADLKRQADSMEIEFQVYKLDGIQRIEARLSEGLTSDPEQSKRVALKRFQQLYEKDRIRMQRAAKGLAKAIQYGIERYPAIVFDGEAVVYGVTDIREAFRRYREWREGGKQ